MHIRFMEIIKNLENEQQKRLKHMVKINFRLTGRRNRRITWPHLMNTGHFINVFHQHDKHNIRLKKLSTSLSRADFVIIATLCYSKRFGNVTTPVYFSLVATHQWDFALNRPCSCFSRQSI